MDNPKVSILIPLYNSELYISETIDSCLNQSYPNIEIIIVDDGSTDNGLKIARQYEMKYTNIRIDTQSNRGAPVARNRAFKLSTGKYIQYIDADDLLHPDKIYLQMEALKNVDERSIVLGRWGTFQNSIENVIWKDLPVNKDYDNPKQFLIELWASGMAAITHVWLLPRVLVEESEKWDESLSKNQDGEFFARIISKAKKVIFVENSIAYYRKDNENSISKQISKKALSSTLKSFETYVNIVKEDIDKPDVRRSLALVYSRYLYFVYPVHQDLIEEVENILNDLGYKNPIMDKNKYYYLSKIIGVYGVIKFRKKIGKKIV